MKPVYVLNAQKGWERREAWKEEVVAKNKADQSEKKGFSQVKSLENLVPSTSHTSISFYCQRRTKMFKKKMICSMIHSRILKKCKISLAKLKVIYNLQTVTN